MIAANLVNEAELRMFPVGDDNTQQRTIPYVTYALVGLNILVFLTELSGTQRLTAKWSRSAIS